MNKRIKSLLLCFAMIVSMLATAVPALAVQNCTLTLSADKETANPGDTITYTLTMGPVTNMCNFYAKLDVPSGLTVVSGEVAENLETTMNTNETPTFTLASLVFDTKDAGTLNNGYTSATNTKLLTFTCKVDEDASGSKTVSMKNISFYEQDDDMTDINYDLKLATVNVTAAPVAVTGVTIDETLSVNIGQTKTPSFTVAPAEATNKTVSFTSDNPAVATVNATTGEVTGVKKGTATITVKTADGNFTDTCTVTVSCAHTNKPTVPAKDSTCTEKGWDEYKKCNDCGQLFNTSDVEINEVPFLNLADHTGGTATCTTKAVCSVCHQPYGNYANHSYTAETKKAEALKTAGNCRDKAVYYYSCSDCGAVESDDAHTFLGDKNASVHVGGTSTVNASEPDHKNQIDGYTGDTKCLGCGVNIATGTSIPAGAHTPSSTWNSDETYHWKECAVQGCDVEIDGSKAEHRPMWKYDNTSHWQVCAVCGAEIDQHQDHQFDGGKTCGVCGYTKGSTIVILDPVDTEKPDLENPGTGAAVSGSSIGYACAALAAVGAIYVGAKKLAKKDEE